MPSTHGLRSLFMYPRSIVGINVSEFTGQQQVYAHAGQWWEASGELQRLPREDAAPWIAFFTALHGRYGTFYLSDPLGASPRGAISGSVTVGSGASRGSTTLPLSGGIGSFAVGDWLQVGTSLHLVVQVNSGSVDVFPKLRASHAQGTAVVYTNAKGVFRLKEAVPFFARDDKLYDGLVFEAIEVIT
jgi:hypothetical protein